MRINHLILIFIWGLLTAADAGATEPNVYSDAKRGFSLEVPEGWEVQPQKEGDLAVALVLPTPLKPFNGSIILSLIDEKLPMPENREELSAIVKQISGPSAQVPNIDDFKVGLSKLDRRKGSAAFFYQASYNLSRVKSAKDRKVKTVNYLFRERGRIFALSLVAPASDYKRLEKIFYGVISSVQVSEAEAGPAVKKKRTR
ncbi:MAG: hypothetical protein HYU99_07350 [Deltaproteobacteria bacterium]|nr:hypothetical protein [Deltaproteobacteria bacterium]